MERRFHSSIIEGWQKEMMASSEKLNITRLLELPLWTSQLNSMKISFDWQEFACRSNSCALFVSYILLQVSLIAFCLLLDNSLQ